jgi:hypothetical protein
VQTQSLLNEIAGRVPLFFGITGHRDIVDEDVPYLKDCVRDLLRNYRSRFPKSPIVFISALAEGVDQIAAEVALEVEGVRLAAVLPMPKNEYVCDFSASHVRTKFEQLLSKASWINVTGFDLSDRDKLYQVCGRNIASLSHVLIVAWNRTSNGKVGGTADTVNFKLGGCVDLKAIGDDDEERYLSRNETGLVFDIPIRRSSEPSVLPEKKTYWSIAAGYTDATERHGISVNVGSAGDAVADLIERLNAEKLGGKEVVVDSQAYITSFFTRVDQLASLYQTSSRRVIKALFAVAIVFALMNPLNQQVHSSATILLEMVTLVLMWALWFYGYRKRLKDRYEDYRSLAEAVRVQGAWQQSGMKDHVADSYLSSQIGELDWLRRAVRSLHALDLWSGNVVGESSLAQLGSVRDHWLEKQRTYFYGVAEEQPGRILKLAKEAVRLTKYAKVLFAAGVVILGLTRLPTIVTFLPGEFANSLGSLFSSEFKWAPYIATLSLALAASLKAYGEIMGFAPVSRRYNSMAHVLSRSLEAFRHIESQASDQRVKKLQSLLLVVGKEALAENGDWIITNRQKDIKPPA